MFSNIDTGGGINWQGWTTALIALAVCVITTLSYFVNRQKLRLDLFEHRFALYHKIQLLVESFATGMEPIDIRWLRRCNRYAIESRYLFGAEVASRVKDLHMLLVDIYMADEMYNDKELSKAERTKAHRTRFSSSTTILPKIEAIREAMIPYLDFSQVGVEGQLLVKARRLAAWCNRKLDDVQ